MIKRWLLSVFLTLLGLANLVRAGLSYRFTGLFTQSNLKIYSLLGIFYGIAAIVFVGLAIICFRHNRNCPAFYTTLGYQVIIWSIRLTTFDSSYARSLWVRDAVFSLIFLAIIFILSQHPQKQIHKHMRR